MAVTTKFYRPYLAQVACAMVNVNGPDMVKPHKNDQEFVKPALLDAHIRKAFEHDRELLLLYHKGSDSLTFSWESTPFNISRRQSYENTGALSITSVALEI